MYKNMKIAITDKVHLKAVCEVLESLGYVSEKNKPENDDKYIIIIDGKYFGWWSGDNWTIQEVTLTDLLRMRDEMVKENANSK